MTTSYSIEGTPNIPVQVFERFLKALEDTDVSAELVARLRKALLEEQTFTESVLKVAVLGEEPLL